MTPLNLCATCGEDFGSLRLFDRHRVGEYGPGDFEGDLEDWTPELGRRCLSVEEMQERGWEIGVRGRWLDPAEVAKRTEALRGSSQGTSAEAA